LTAKTSQSLKMADFDEEMQRALEMSAQEHMATSTTLVLDGEVQVARRNLTAPCTQHWKAPHRPQDGLVLQVDTVNQFSQHWAPLIREFSSPSSICGYMVMANVLALQRLLPRGGLWSQTQLRQLLQGLRDPAELEPSLREAMRFVAVSRSEWITKHAADFRTDAASKNYLSAWVANYEISDFFQIVAARGGLNGAPVHFVRYNQWPQHSAATHEERARLAEEERFGGSVDSAGRVIYKESDATFLVEGFTPERCLQTPEMFLKNFAADRKPPLAPAVFVADLNGHFVTCVAVHLESTQGEVKPALIVINTTGTSYLDNPTCAFTFDLVYPPEASDASAVEGVPHPSKAGAI